MFLELACRLKPNMELRFWRTKSGQEIDFVLLKDRVPFLIEAKSNPRSLQVPSAFRSFLERYPETSGGLVFSEFKTGAADCLGKRVEFAALSEFPDLADRLTAVQAG